MSFFSSSELTAANNIKSSVFPEGKQFFEDTLIQHMQQNMPVYSGSKVIRHGLAGAQKAQISNTVARTRPYIEIPITFTPSRVKPAFQQHTNIGFNLDQTIDHARYSPLELYGQTTHPDNHSSESYRYLVHAFHSGIQTKSDIAASAQTSPVSFHEANKSKLSHSQLRSEAYNNPLRLGDVLSLSASLINQDKRKTYGSAGYILETSNSNIIAARGSDLYVNNASIDSVMEVAKQGRLTAYDLLAETSYTDINEVLIGGNAMQLGPIRITGMFYTVDKKGEPINPQNAEHFKKLAKTYGLKSIALPE